MNLGLCSIVFLILLVMQLTAVINVSWWLILSPLIIAFSFWFLVILFFVFVLLIEKIWG